MQIFNLLANLNGADLAVGGAMFMGQLFFSLIMYLVVSFSLYTIAKNNGQENPWFAFVPILNIILMVNLAGKEMWWVILFFIPCVNLIAAVIVLMGVAEAAGKPNWWGILLIIPCVNIVAWPMMAFGKN